MAETKTRSENKPRSGLSINDTVAANANLSTGATGVDVSGVKAGAGAGAGSTYVTPAASGSSPAPEIVPGSRGSGMTPRGTIATDEKATVRLPSTDEISARAYERWHQRGCPEGSADVDWREAEEELKMKR
ncbi:MAG TPA: DUF2934 domain-containing protein [Bryobacteraceae bacterium]